MNSGTTGTNSDTNEFDDMIGTKVTVELPGTDVPEDALEKLKRKILIEALKAVEELGTNIGGSCHGKAHCKMG